ncbi:MAG: hypothetical protein WA979_10250 [Pacificimonas sp.]
MSISIGDIWIETKAELAANLRRYALPAAAFVFLPQLAVSLLVPPIENLTEPIPPMTVAAMLLSNIIAVMGALALTILALSGVNDAQAIRRAGQLFPLGVVISIAAQIAIGLGMIALILPGLFLWARLMLVIPAYVAEGVGVADAFRRSWALTAGIWAKLLAALIVMTLAMVIFSALGGGVGQAAGLPLITGITAGFAAAAYAVVIAIFAAFVYQRQTA